jgi:hypothetical protein
MSILGIYCLHLRGRSRSEARASMKPVESSVDLHRNTRRHIPEDNNSYIWIHRYEYLQLFKFWKLWSIDWQRLMQYNWFTSAVGLRGFSVKTLKNANIRMQFIYLCHRNSKPHGTGPVLMPTWHVSEIRYENFKILDLRFSQPWLGCNAM